MKLPNEEYRYLSISISIYLYPSVSISHTRSTPNSINTTRRTPFSLLLSRMGRENRVEKLRDLLPVTFMQKTDLCWGKLM